MAGFSRCLRNMDNTPITSSSNSKIKAAAQLLTKKGRNEQGEFLIEGIKLIIEAMESGLTLTSVFVLDELWDEYSPLFSSCACNVICVSSNVLEKLSDCQTPQGIIGQFSMPKEKSPQGILATGGLVLFLDGVSDCGNLGTLIRTCEAAGVSGIITSKGSAEIFSPKTVRSAMGAAFRVPVYQGISHDELKELIEEFDYSLASLDMNGENIYTADISSVERIMLALGNEAHGISAYTAQLSDIILSIPMCGKIESLNVAMAGGIAMFEIKRQKTYHKA